jgi:hypothetical protein
MKTKEETKTSVGIGWFCKNHAKANGARIYRNIKSGYPVTVSLISAEKPEDPSFVKVGEVDLSKSLQDPEFPSPQPKTRIKSDVFNYLNGVYKYDSDNGVYKYDSDNGYIMEKFHNANKNAYWNK